MQKLFWNNEAGSFLCYVISNKISINSVLHGLFSGFSFRSKVKNDPEGNLSVIQMKDLEAGYTRIGADLTMISSANISAKYLLQKNDILFISKGWNNFAVEYQPNLHMAIAASAFFILRPDPAKVFPSYLAWYINQLPVQKYLKEKTAGTYIPNVNKDTLEGIMILLPPMDVQKKIVMIDNLRKQEHELLKEISLKRKALVSTALLMSIQDRIT
jgi:restriction endonuclease S subunit